VSIQKSEAILLSQRDIRETSSLAVFYTESFGKIKALIKAVRGAQAKSSIYLREFAKYDIVYYETRKSDTSMVTQCDLKDAYLEIAEDLSKRLTAYYILELVDKFTALEDKSRQIYSLLEWILEFIRKERLTRRVIIIFQLKLLEYAGLLPQLDTCVNCSSKAIKDAYFSVRLSGLLCTNCHDADIQASPLSKGAIASINMIRRQEQDKLGRSMITSEISKELKRMLDGFIAYHLGEHLKTTDFMKQLSMY